MDISRITYEEGLQVVSQRYAMTKTAEGGLSGLLSKLRIPPDALAKVTSTLKNPAVAYPLIGAAAGTGLGALSTTLQPKKRRNYLGRMLSGAVGGAAGGGGLYALLSGIKQLDAPSIHEDISNAVIRASTKPDAPTGAAAATRSLLNPEVLPATADAAAATRSPLDIARNTALIAGEYTGLREHKGTSTDWGQAAGVGGTVAVADFLRDVIKRKTLPTSLLGRIGRPFGALGNARALERIKDTDLRAGIADALKTQTGDARGMFGADKLRRRLFGLRSPKPAPVTTATGAYEFAKSELPEMQERVSRTEALRGIIDKGDTTATEQKRRILAAIEKLKNKTPEAAARPGQLANFQTSLLSAEKTIKAAEKILKSRKYSADAKTKAAEALKAAIELRDTRLDDIHKIQAEITKDTARQPQRATAAKTLTDAAKEQKVRNAQTKPFGGITAASELRGLGTAPRSIRKRLLYSGGKGSLAALITAGLDQWRQRVRQGDLDVGRALSLEDAKQRAAAAHQRVGKPLE